MRQSTPSFFIARAATEGAQNPGAFSIWSNQSKPHFLDHTVGDHDQPRLRRCVIVVEMPVDSERRHVDHASIVASELIKRGLSPFIRKALLRGLSVFTQPPA
jgi:hypothetical protein